MSEANVVKLVQYSNEFYALLRKQQGEHHFMPLSQLPASLLAQLPQPHNVDLIAGGPPCQGFTLMNRSRKVAENNVFLHPGNQQCKVFLDYCEYFRPKYVLFENVPGILHHKSSALRVVCKVLLCNGYQVRFVQLNSAMYGVPQSRVRIVLLAALQGLRLPDFPAPTHASPARSLAGECFKQLAVTPRDGDLLYPPLCIRRAIGDLPRKQSSRPTPYARPPSNNFQTAMRLGAASYVCDHLGFEIKRSARISKAEWSGLFPTITTSMRMRHPASRRGFTVRELARSQGFPDTTYFSGTKKQCIQQISNAVPVPLARAIGREIMLSTGLPPQRYVFDELGECYIELTECSEQSSASEEEVLSESEELDCFVLIEQCNESQ
jgi:DNA (cytosine-5)-methyltransferase 1